MPDWLLLLLLVVFIVGGAIVGKKLKLIPPPKVESNAAKLNLAVSFAGTITGGRTTTSPGRQPCIAYGVVIGRMEGDETETFVELHRGGWTDGFEVRTADGNMVSVPRGPLHVEGEWDEAEDGVDVTTYLVAADVPDEASNAVFTSKARILESLVEMNAKVTVHATRFEVQAVGAVEAHDTQPPYRDGKRRHAAQGHILVRAVS